MTSGATRRAKLQSNRHHDFTGAKDDGSDGDNWSCQICQTITTSKPQHPAFYRTDALPIAEPTMSKR